MSKIALASRSAPRRARQGRGAWGGKRMWQYNSPRYHVLPPFLLLGVALSLTFMGCKDDLARRKRQVGYDLDKLRAMAKDSASEEGRKRAVFGMQLLQNGVDDETPFVVTAQVAYEDVPAVKEGGNGHGIIVKFISEVFAEGTLELSDGKDGWIPMVLGDERRRESNELAVRGVIVPIKLMALPPGDDASRVEGRYVRMVIRGKASNPVRLERVVP